MFSLVVGAAILIAATIILFIETSMPLAPQVFIAVSELFLLLLMFRPDNVRRKEIDAHMNAILKFNDEQKTVEKCKGCAHIREPFGKCSVYLYPWEAWVNGYDGICDRYKKIHQDAKEGGLDG
jgi:hypothetical protein